MKYAIEWLEIKSPDWKVVSLKSPDGQTLTDVSINRKNKKGEVFPNFDAIVQGGMVDGNYWRSDAGKNYLFAPDPEGPKGVVGGKGNIGRAMERKEQSIEKFQDNKEEGIKTSSTLRDAVILAKTEVDAELVPASELTARIEHWRTWLLAHWDLKQAPVAQPSSEGINPEDIPF